MDTETVDLDAKGIEAKEAGFAAAGEPTAVNVQADYFGFEETYRCVLPDGVSYIEHRALNEGARRKYLNKVNRDVVLQRASGDAKISTAPGDERKALLEAAICGWNLTRGGSPVAFTTQELNNFLDKVNPKVIDLVEKDIRLHNPWLLAEMTVEDIDREIASLEEMKAKIIEEQEGKGASN
jgi:hypothetical protein